MSQTGQNYQAIYSIIVYFITLLDRLSTAVEWVNCTFTVQNVSSESTEQTKQTHPRPFKNISLQIYIKNYFQQKNRFNLFQALKYARK